MVLRLSHKDRNFEAGFRALLAMKREVSEDVDQAVRAIIEDVRARGDAAVIAALLKGGADANEKLPLGRRPLMLAARSGQVDAVRALIEHGADVNARLTALPPYRAKLDRGNDTMFQAGTTALLRAAKAADLPAIELLIEHGADARLGTNRVGITPLLAAAGVGTNESDSTGRQKTQADAIGALKIFLDHGVDVNSPDNNGRTALHGAALQGYNDVIRFLATKGASLDAKDNKGFTPLDVALGKAGGFGFAGSEGVRREATADLIRRLVSGTSEDKTAAR